MTNDIIEVIQERLKMLYERELLCADECRVLRLLVEEIKQQYIKLPADADGVPIHLDDVVAAQDEQPFEVRAFQLDALGWFAIERLGSQWNVNQLHHVQKDTVESLLEEYAQDKSEDWRIACNRYFREHCWSKDWLQDPEFSVVHCDNIAEYAERIRKAVE